MENLRLRAKTKTELCLCLKKEYCLKFYPRNFTAISYTKSGYIQSFAVKISSNNHLCFSYDDYYHKYRVMEDLTCEYNKHVLSLKSK